MTLIKYPNGNRYIPKQAVNRQLAVKKKHDEVLFGHRGMALEDELNASNEYYRATEQAVVYKKPTPVQIVKVDYPKRAKAVIKEAYFRQPSTTDYNGVYQGRYLDFEAKETKNKKSFPLKNFHQHQIDHFSRCLLQQGICFVIVKFVSLQRLFLYPATQLIIHWNEQESTGHKSIALADFEKHGFEIDYAIQPTIPYLKAVDQLIMH
ncbi:Holliday junction-specific endonuclease [Agrilactobacillus composti DSM 18527 = JCM 14202]|uniref:Holliday junction resolvase RecU n=1 Tax=Agrilactobacillus composti DSM 18527 = JCM 14202 TaxID=1423734 RepID=X0PTJ3_9LACO|nr:Holliday junction resolvase RecU [Agrilactobacillus composti]KRM36490.1 Holliday junction-specific endonuclease [Agrilactobacillus composti DSM 18527 = JCM 14202]GAF41342.1 RecU Holliday junction resolvase [Agrilactobacillus composti DSM 18527 = JCM 14202]